MLKELNEGENEGDPWLGLFKVIFAGIIVGSIIGMLFTIAINTKRILVILEAGM